MAVSPSACLTLSSGVLPLGARPAPTHLAHSSRSVIAGYSLSRTGLQVPLRMVSLAMCVTRGCGGSVPDRGALN